MIEEQKTLYEIYTDGACSGNPGEGGCSYVLLDRKNNIEHRESFYTSETTNNRMEMTAAIRGLSKLKQISDSKVSVRVLSDSQYLVNSFNKRWIYNWRQNNWKTSQGSDVKNQDLWEELISLRQLFFIEWEWVRGHSGNSYNEICDELARGAIETQGGNYEQVDLG